MEEIYNWQASDIAKGQAMLDAINSYEVIGEDGESTPIFPIIDGRYRMDRWAEELTVYEDDSVGFERLPEAWLEKLGISQEARDAMLAAYTPTILSGDDIPPVKVVE